MASPTSAAGEPAGVEEAGRRRPGRVEDRLAQALAGKGEVGGAGEVAGHRRLEIDDGARSPRAHGRDRLGTGGHDEVAAEDQARTAGRHARRADLVLGRARSSGGVRTAPPFCAMPIMSSAATPLPSRCAAMPSRAADRDHAGAADAGDQDAVGPVERR